MLQIDHVYEFLYQELFNDFEFWHLFNGVPKLGDINISDISLFTPGLNTNKKILFYDQEPFIQSLTRQYIDIFSWTEKYTISELIELNEKKSLPYNISSVNQTDLKLLIDNPQCVFKKKILVVSEKSIDVDSCIQKNNCKSLYYFFHGFAAIDWYRGYYALNYDKTVVRPYKYDFISFNRIIIDDRSYRIYFVSLLKELGLLDQGLVSFNVTDNVSDDWRDEVSDPNSKLSEQAKQHAETHLVDVDKLVIDNANLHGSASADIPRTIPGYCPNNDQPNVDAFWHIVTETVFYYPKLHLTEKIFKPIVSKQSFMLLAAPGNLAYLKSYGFKTFEGIIDETYDTIEDNDLRIEAVVRQLAWYCGLSDKDKTDVMRAVEPIVLHNFHHFYGDFKQVITRELLDNTKTLFKDIDYNDSHINYNDIYHVLTR
jgi:hypothetical protein